MTCLCPLRLNGRLLILLVGFCCHPVAAPADESIYALVTDKEVDEQLYLVRRLELLHRVFAADLSKGDQLAADLLATRYEMARIKEYAEAKSMDKRLVELYADSLQLIDQYSKVLMDIGAIERQFERDLSEHTITGITRGFTEGLEAGGGMAAVGVEPMTGAAIIAGLAIEKTYSAQQQRQKLQDEKDFTKLRRYHDFEVERSRLLGRIQVQAGILAEKFKWLPTEVGFDSTAEEEEQLLAAVGRGDYGIARERLDAVRKLRPRDPFVCEKLAQVRLLEVNAVTDDQGDLERISILKKAMQDRIRAAELVPSDHLHDPMRAAFLMGAADIASSALYFAEKHSTLPLQLANAALQFNRRDPEGEIQQSRVIALMRTGDHSQALASLDQLGRLHGIDADQHLLMARVLSSSKNPVESIAHLHLAWKLGQHDVRALRRHRELRCVRDEAKNAFEKLVAPSWSGEVSYGYVWNDFTFKNHSSFPLTDVAIKTSWQDADGKELVEIYWIDAMEAAGTAVLSNVFNSASDNRESPPKVTSEVICDESRSVEPTLTINALGDYRGIGTCCSWDGLKVFDSSDLQLSIRRDADGITAASLKSESRQTELLIDDIRDSCCFLKRRVDDVVVGGMWFSGNVAYGWYLDPARDDGGRIVFWLDR